MDIRSFKAMHDSYFYSLAFDTVYNEREEKAVVENWDLCFVDKTFKHCKGKGMDSLLDLLKIIQKPAYIYDHELDFDSKFLMDYFLRRDMKCLKTFKGNRKADTFAVTINSKTNKIYQLKLKLEKEKDNTVYFWNSRNLADIDYQEIMEGFEMKNLVPAELVRNRSEIIARFTKELLEEEIFGMTIGSAVFNNYKDFIHTNFYNTFFPELPIETDDFIRESLKGGIRATFKKGGKKEFNNVLVYDINSSYPYQMCSQVMPFGVPFEYEGNYELLEEDIKRQYPLYIQKVLVSLRVKPHHMPCLLIEEQGETTLIRGDFQPISLTLTNIDMEMLKEHYDIESIEYGKGLAFQGVDKMLFSDFIEPLYKKKKESTGAKREIYKLIINNIWGKFGSNPRYDNKMPFINGDDILDFGVEEQEITKPKYTATACFTTAYGRKYLVDSIMQNADNIVYCDTDSMHLLAPAKGIKVGNELGEWKLEKVYSKSKYLTTQTYIGKSEEGLDIKISGATKEIKRQIDFDNFENGTRFKGAKVVQIVKGGARKLEGIFTLGSELLRKDLEYKPKGFELD